MHPRRSSSSNIARSSTERLRQSARRSSEVSSLLWSSNASSFEGTCLGARSAVASAAGARCLADVSDGDGSRLRPSVRSAESRTRPIRRSEGEGESLNEETPPRACGAAPPPLERGFNVGSAEVLLDLGCARRDLAGVSHYRKESPSPAGRGSFPTLSDSRRNAFR